MPSQAPFCSPSSVSTRNPGDSSASSFAFALSFSFRGSFAFSFSLAGTSCVSSGGFPRTTSSFWSSPSRRTTTSTLSPGLWARTAAARASKSFGFFPSNRRMTSPVWIPALSALEPSVTSWTRRPLPPSAGAVETPRNALSSANAEEARRTRRANAEGKSVFMTVLLARPAAGVLPTTDRTASSTAGEGLELAPGGLRPRDPVEVEQVVLDGVQLDPDRGPLHQGGEPRLRTEGGHVRPGVPPLGVLEPGADPVGTEPGAGPVEVGGLGVGVVAGGGHRPLPVALEAVEPLLVREPLAGGEVVGMGLLPLLEVGVLPLADVLEREARRG